MAYPAYLPTALLEMSYIWVEMRIKYGEQLEPLINLRL